MLTTGHREGLPPSCPEDVCLSPIHKVSIRIEEMQNHDRATGEVWSRPIQSHPRVESKGMGVTSQASCPELAIHSVLFASEKLSSLKWDRLSSLGPAGGRYSMKTHIPSLVYLSTYF